MMSRFRMKGYLIQTQLLREVCVSPRFVLKLELSPALKLLFSPV